MNLQELLALMPERKASDLLLGADTPPLFRINGELVKTEFDALSPQAVKELIYSMLSEAHKVKFEKSKELDLPYETEGSARFRVNIHMQRGTAAAAIRIIPSEIPTLEELRLPKAVADLASEPRGLVLVTGPTGSGKTTTQACMVNMINNSRNCHIITIEDPIEYVHKNMRSMVEQREVGIDTDSFNTALKYVLRQNPDVILIGEMRDLETIQTALTAAETGHLVISTLHTNDSVQALDRIIDVFPPYQQTQIRLQLSLVLQGIISQQLLPKADGSGMIVAVEILKATTGVRNIIRKAQTQELYSMIEIGAKYGMQSMDVALKDLYQRKIITYEAALSRAIQPEHLAKVLSE
ncbi:MAG: type IV pilus twitching motility protein PilT [Candidatus Saganbacteria bacterium]|nr:type IV pilus twitching motility protein PilT [Candidatus Saganbacteria bacterium]